VGVHDVVGGGNSGGDSGGGSWSSEVGGAPQSMPGKVALVTSPASRGVDDADDALKAVGGGGGEGRDDGNSRAAANRAVWQATLGHCHGNDHRHDEDVGYADRGAGSDDAPLDDGRKKRIRRMG